MMDDFPYEISASEKVKNLETDLERELKELKDEIEENEMVHGITRAVSSVPLPRDVVHFRKEREQVILRGMEVSQARPITVQADAMAEELETAGRSDYEPEAMPLLLHQFFNQRIRELVQCKHMHMLRWKRFNEHTSTMEALYPQYQERLGQIMLEYNDCLQRAQRLSCARESFFANNSNSVLSIKTDDMLIYLRWLVCHMRSVKRFNQFMRLLQWLPINRKTETTPVNKEHEADDNSTSARIPSKYQDENFLGGARSAASHSRPGSAASGRSMGAAVPPTPPPVNPTIINSNPLPASQLVLALAAAGGGMASDEDTLSLPLHMIEFDKLRSQISYLVHMYGIELDVENIRTSADEMELYAFVSRKFRQVYTRQEHMKTYKTYDRVEIGQENWGADHSMHALKQQSNWLPYVALKPEKDPHQEKKLVELRMRKNVDELLRVQSKFIHVSDGEKIQDALREHAAAIREPDFVEPVKAWSKRDTESIAAVWKRIYTNPELYKNEDKLDAALKEVEEKEAGDRGQKKRSPSAKKRRDSYDYFDAVQLLGLDDGEQDSNDPASIQGGYLSFLQLRHLRIRDLQRTCLSILNYFRSVERTMTINDQGLSLEAGRFKRTSAQDHRRGVSEGGMGGSGGLGSHAYMHYTPRDFKLAETEFMEFAEVENHDDFYTQEEGRVHVQDQRGYYIIYEAALNDLKKLEEDLLLMATHYIEKDKDKRYATGITGRINNSARRRQQNDSAGHFTIEAYGHQEVDRFAVLLDLWSNEAAFLECKREVYDCYLEAYHHVFDRDEKRSLAQVLTNVAHRRPRYDFAAAYFVKSYRMECVTLRLQANLVKSILDRQIEEQREYVQKVIKEGDKDFGLPHRIIQKQPIAVNMSRSALKNVYMMEFHPSLAVAAQIPAALQSTYWELYHMHRPETVTETIILEKKLLECALKDWDKIDKLGSSYSMQVQKDLFAGNYIEDPKLVDELARTMVYQSEQDSLRKSAKEKQLGLIKAVGKVLNLVAIRHRMLDSAGECEFLSKLYRKQAVFTGYDECHMFLRFVQFEFANINEQAGKPPPVFITSVNEDDSINLDRYIPNQLYLAIHEVDESHVGRFTFRNRDGINQLLTDGGLESFKVVLMTQVVHKNALTGAVQQLNECQPVKDLDVMKNAGARPGSPDTKSEKSSATAMTGMSSGTGATSLGVKLTSGAQVHKRAPEAFVSLQLEKGPSRDLMLNEFVNKKQKMGATVLKNPEQMELLKRGMISAFAERLLRRVSQFSLRSQILAYYNGILKLLEDYPDIRETYFMLGEPKEKKTAADSAAGLETDPRTLHQRPRRVLSEDGKDVLNLWFVPHYTETCVMYRQLADEECNRALDHHLRIVAGLHDILQYLCAHSRLGSAQAVLGSSKSAFVSADWGGSEGIGADLREIQRQTDHLESKTSPEQVCKLLALRRDVMFLQFDTAVRQTMRETFLARGNKPAYQAITDCMHFPLNELSNAQKPGFNSVYFPVPEPMEARDPRASSFFPFRSFINRNGPFPVHFWSWQQIEHNMQLCLAGLKDVDKHTANGELLGVSLLMEDVLLSGHQDQAIYGASDDEDAQEEGADEGKNQLTSAHASQGSRSRPGSGVSTVDGHSQKGKKVPTKKLSKTTHPIESYTLLKSFLLLWKRLEVFKMVWVKRKLIVEVVNTPTLYKEYCKEYKKVLLFPIIQSIARRCGQGDQYEAMITDEQPVVLPRGASEVEVKTRQLIKLLEGEECFMINEVRKKLAKELNLVLAERAREETALPTDLWKKPSIKESFTMNKPHIAEDFITNVMSVCEEDGEKIVFTKSHLNKCLGGLASEIMAREKHNFESYSMYYENLLRTHHQMLYQREQEVKQVKDQLRMAKHNTMVEVQCQLADTSTDLLLEITALRSKVSEMRQLSMDQEGNVREKVKEEYNELVHNMFSSSFDLKKKFDEFREYLHDDVYDLISETRHEASDMMARLRDRSMGISDEERENRNLMHANQVRHVQHENHQLSILLMKMKAMNDWRLSIERGQHSKYMSKLKKSAEISKKDHQRVKMMHENEVLLIQEQMEAIRTALRASEKECNDVKRELDKELKAKKEKQHTAQQRAQSQKQLEDARRANIDKLLEEIDDKDSKLKNLSDEQDKHKRMKNLTQDKAKKEVTTVKKQLNHERTLKLDAYQRVDELQTAIYDIEGGLYSRPPTAATTRPQTAMSSTKSIRSRIQSAGSKRTPSRGTGTSMSNWPPPVSFPANRSLTPAADFYGGHHSAQQEDMGVKKIQRPKTVIGQQLTLPRVAFLSPRESRKTPSVGRLRSRIAEQLLNEIDPPDHHETIRALKETPDKGVLENAY